MSTKQQFQPVSTFSWEINRAERGHQVLWPAPLLGHPEGRVWFLERLKCKYKGGLSTGQYERHQMMGGTLARRLGKKSHFGNAEVT